MRLKKLEITGFKSFANKTALEFNESITAVVGPNGSGKSNIADAMRWVLGEQSLRGLRLKSSEDLIFAGSNKKSRLGAAQVFLYLDNQTEKLKDFPEEISIGRKYFRNGESECYINGKPVRLKDVFHLAAQAGIGAKSYAIITQGMADAILSASPKDRRAIFEEAAGVKIFQLKKEETLRKLDSTKNNLVRVDDLLREILPHLKFLERQAKKAEKRQNLENELKEKQGRFYGFKLDYLEKKLKGINSEQNALNQKIAALTKELGRAREELNIQNEKTGQKDEEEIELENKLNKLQDERNGLTREIALLEGKIEVLTQFATVSVDKVAGEGGGIKLDLNETGEDVREIFNSYKRLEERILKADTIEELFLIKEEFQKLGDKIKTLYEKFSFNDTDNLVDTAKNQASKKNNDSGKEEELDRLGLRKISLQSELDKINKEIELLRNGFQTIKEQERIGRKKFFDLERQIRLNEDQILISENKLKDLMVEEERLSLERQEIVSNIKEYDIELKPAGETFDSNKLEIEISRLKRQLDEIGGIDEAVVKEFQETNERYVFLAKEKEDLEKADKDLREAINMLNYKINNQFNEKFKEINEEFNKYFKIIFGGGKAFLKKIKEPKKRKSDKDNAVAEEESDVLAETEEKDEITEEEGVDIKVSLPNKKIENINVMSGGERALTSIAVLFAIIGANPPPFCVLDEVDAALDDANAYRFSKILEELSSRAQFVIITHNRETMRAAKVLYGITMEEEGVSKLVSVKLEG